MIWSLVQQIGGQAASMAVFLVLAALLSPSDFGLLGMAGAWLAVLNAFCETGLGAALIQREHLREEHRSSTFGINVAVGAALTVLGVLLSWPAAAYFRTPALQPVMAVLSLAFLLRSFGLTQAALVQRDLHFRALALRDLTSSLVGGAIGIALALGGYGVWSLVVMTLTSALVETVLLWRVVQWRPRRLEISRQAAAELWPYSSRMLAFNLFKALAQNTDRLVIGPLLGVRALGWYTLALRLVIFPVTTLVGAVGAYLFPKVARLQRDRAAVHAVYRAVLVGTLNLLIPGLAAVAILAPTILPLLGKGWAGAIPVAQILTLAALSQALMAPVGQLMKGLGRPGWLVAWSVGLTLVTAAALGVGARWGLTGVALAYVAVHLAALPAILGIGRRLTGLGPAEVLAVTWRPAAAAAVLAATLEGVAHLAGPAAPAVLVVTTLLLAPAYLMLLLRLNPEFKGLVVRELQRLRPGAGVARAVSGG
jgi:PST family polysaccharide transporter